MAKLAKKNAHGSLVCLGKLIAHKSKTQKRTKTDFLTVTKERYYDDKDRSYDKATGQTDFGLSLRVIFKTNPKECTAAGGVEEQRVICIIETTLVGVFG